MFRIKLIDKYVSLRFLELFFATFFISSFILLMQFIWNHIDKIVGKGLEGMVFVEFFFYGALSVVPLALPLAILLASLMAFGNLGEKMELTAMKAAGISLFRIMSSLIVLISFVCVAAFFFSNNVLPITQQRLSTLISSLKAASPELEIPVGEFYSGIDGYNIYVKDKDTDKKLLKEIMIYDFSNGFNNATVTVADSARLKMSDDKTYLSLSLYDGESFENLKKSDMASTEQSVPYRRESFERKDIIIDFDANFNRLDESMNQNRYMSKNIARLTSSIDSIDKRVDSISMAFAQRFDQQHFFTQAALMVPIKDSVLVQNEKLRADTLFFRMEQSYMEMAITHAIAEAQRVQNEIDNNKTYISAEDYIGIRHKIEWHRKFTLSFACLVFFFIGAPLGAIIRKGGLGLPIVISVVMFIIYYIIDNSGFKLAREDVWPVWQGIWLSSACLLPFGIFLTYKAATDSPIFNSESYLRFIRKIKARFRKKQDANIDKG